MDKITIIGCGGVGAAHALSSAKYLSEHGGGHITLVDVRVDVLQRFVERKWKNSWGPIADEYIVPDTVTYELHQLNGDLIPDKDTFYIIATPDIFHLRYLYLLSGMNVLVEKPLHAKTQDSKYITFSYDNFHYGIEWLYHPSFQFITEYENISFIHGFPPALASNDNRWQVFDLGSHVVSIALYLNPNFEVKKVEHHGMITEVNDGELIFGYDSRFPDVINIDNRILDWIPFENNDLFYRQIQYIMEGNKPKIPWNDIIKSMDMLKGMV